MRPKHLLAVTEAAAAVESDNAGIAHDAEDHTPPHQPG